jgi:hypothetical protein
MLGPLQNAGEINQFLEDVGDISAEGGFSKLEKAY